MAAAAGGLLAFRAPRHAMETHTDDHDASQRVQVLLQQIADARLPDGTVDSRSQKDAAEALVAILYQDLRRIAGAYLSRERADHSLSPTELVHEAYFRLVGQERVEWQGRTHFLGIAAQAMRRILVDHARRHLADKRGGDWHRISLETVGVDASTEADLDAERLVALDGALDRLAELDPRQARIVEMRYFGGMSVPEVAAALDIGRRTVDRDWAHARSWLKREVAGN